ncbi:MAG: iron-sulfur cluster assembly accessory protein, partial [Proteobacteria bacterium]|nr:iron-sulfur cluster assembly accessory protein [Pseudomonadota bacterium]
YTMEYVSSVDPLDEIIRQDGAVVMIAPMAQMFLFGTEIDFESGLLESGFRFRNPNVSETCGCGESIQFDTGGKAAPAAAPEPLAGLEKK